MRKNRLKFIILISILIIIGFGFDSVKAIVYPQPRCPADGSDCWPEEDREAEGFDWARYILHWFNADGTVHEDDLNETDPLKKHWCPSVYTYLDEDDEGNEVEVPMGYNPTPFQTTQPVKGNDPRVSLPEIAEFYSAGTTCCPDGKPIACGGLLPWPPTSAFYSFVGGSDACAPAGTICCFESIGNLKRRLGRTS